MLLLGAVALGASCRTCGRCERLGGWVRLSLGAVGLGKVLGMGGRARAGTAPSREPLGCWPLGGGGLLDPGRAARHCGVSPATGCSGREALAGRGKPGYA